jgi:hypothetical protein
LHGFTTRANVTKETRATSVKLHYGLWLCHMPDEKVMFSFEAHTSSTGLCDFFSPSQSNSIGTLNETLAKM